MISSQWSICPSMCEGSVEMTLSAGSDCARDLRRVLDKKVSCELSLSLCCAKLHLSFLGLGRFRWRRPLPTNMSRLDRGPIIFVPASLLAPAEASR